SFLLLLAMKDAPSRLGRTWELSIKMLYHAFLREFYH
ncbi:MAG: hypothetical protein ACJA0J_002278, partial [Bdellovibrionota bacterium]